ncbi:MAG: hypothetical protein F4056_03000 [Chloroflexi bacterium]|nr:hypothetical protein [Chloroflexota bacterium]MYI82305.1 hypothetical protein [Chloroflexota bacterium]
MPSEFSGLDIEEMGRVIDEAGVLIIRFHVIPQRLLVDTRESAEDSPQLRLVPPVSSAEERYRYLQKLRPGVPLPDQITVLSWPRYIEVMRDAGLWQRLEQRMFELGGAALARRCGEVFDEVRSAERAEVVSAIIGGEGYESLWESAPTT